MKRREFIAGLGSAAGWPLLVRAQQQTKPIIGHLFSGMNDGDFLETLRRSLKNSGYIEGQNVVIEHRYADQQYDRLPRLRPIWFGAK